MGQESDGISRREWSTPIREPWNPLIKECLSGIDRHNCRYLMTGDRRDAALAGMLRKYVAELKALIHELEADH